MFREFLNPSLLGQDRVLKAELEKTPGVTIYQHARPEFVRKPRKLADRSRPYGEIHKMSLDAALGEKSECLSRFSALVRSEDLDFHMPPR